MHKRICKHLDEYNMQTTRKNKKESLKIAMTLAKQYSDKIKKIYRNIDSIYLFGSYVKGNFKEYSDIDIAVIMKNVKEKNFFDVEAKLMTLRWDIDLRIEPHLFSRRDFDDGHPLSDGGLKNGIKIN